MKNIEILNLSKNRLSSTMDFQFFFPKLETVDISDNQLKTFDELIFLEICENVVEINFSGNELNTKEFFKACLLFYFLKGTWRRFLNSILIWR